MSTKNKKTSIVLHYIIFLSSSHENRSHPRGVRVIQCDSVLAGPRPSGHSLLIEGGGLLFKEGTFSEKNIKSDKVGHFIWILILVTVSLMTFLINSRIFTLDSSFTVLKFLNIAQL